jgi:plastocyanin domain-containing protein
MNNSTKYILIVVIIVVAIAIYAVISLNTNNAFTGSLIGNLQNGISDEDSFAPITEGYQNVNVWVVNRSYVFEYSVVANVPVRLIANMSMFPSCARKMVMPDYGIRKNFTNEDNILEFTPTSAGEINVSCSMNSYKGQLKVS